jgi:NAD(P)-dependent dehydrogenase (short-subunit alcohol dehydrogenase family)
MAKKEQQFPGQEQQPPGKEHEMHPQPQSEMKDYKGADKLKGKVAIITGADSGIGRATAIGYAKEGADIAIIYKDEHEDAEKTERLVRDAGGRAFLMAGDIGDEAFCKKIVKRTLDEFGKIDILVNNAAEQHPQDKLEDISTEQWHRTFATNIHGIFYLTKAALPHLKEGAVILNTTSVVPYRGSDHLIDYGTTKGAILGFTRCLAKNLADRKIRVNAVAPGPIWTPLIPSTFPEERVKTFGANTPLGRAGQPDEVAPSFIFLASEGGTYMTGQVLHPDGGQWLGG